MGLFESIASSIQNIFANKMRSLFTMFGIIIGVASVILITSIGNGFRNTMTGFFEDMGLDEIQIFHTSETRQIEWHERLNLSDAEFLRNHSNILAVSTNASVTYQNAIDIIGTTDRRAVQLLGVDEYRQLFRSGPDIIYGRHIVATDVINMSNVIVIDESFSRSVFGITNSVGRTMEISTNLGNQTFTVVGILESNDMFAMIDIFEMPYEARVPITLVQSFQNLGNVVGSIDVRVINTDTIHSTGDDIIRLLEIRKNAPDIFNSSSIASTLNEVDAVITVFTVFLTLVASISLLVGGIGVMNIMLVSVTERTKEIGIRKSLGATTHSIVFQFLVEAAILTAIGGTIGIILGYLGGIVVAYIANILVNLELVPSIDVPTIGVIVLISASIGLLFGVYPARKASKLDPVESLRFE
ncbi:MAG: ABC transporter permease [Defluviitaleaceae bacterium]|nr:ABC transporter permease [Defluviitaleaceae bacterium]